MANSKSFPLREVIDELLSSQISLVSPLMKLVFFGRITKNKKLSEYTGWELNGYNLHEPQDVPSYRKAKASVYARIMSQDGSRHEQQIPSLLVQQMFKDKVGQSFPDILTNVFVIEGIGTVEHLVSKLSSEESQRFGKDYPMEFLPNITPIVNKVYPYTRSCSVVGAYCTTSPTLSIEIINAVRKNLLDLAVEISEEFGYYIEIDTFQKDNQKINQIINNFMNTITNNGDGNINNTGHDSHITATINIKKGDVTQLNEELKKLGVEEQDIRELNDIIKTSEPVKNNTLPVAASNWVGRVISTGGKITIGTAAGVLVQLIKAHFGLT